MIHTLLDQRIAEAFPDPADRPIWTAIVRAHKDYPAVAKMQASDRVIGFQLDRILAEVRADSTQA
jgi:hypothetical protein